MNKIYKVVWSKVKNRYVVVSEIAKNVISGSVKSAKVGVASVAKGMVLGALMAFAITGNAWAGVFISSTKNGDVDDIYTVGIGSNASVQLVTLQEMQSSISDATTVWNQSGYNVILAGDSIQGALIDLDAAVFENANSINSLRLAVGKSANADDVANITTTGTTTNVTGDLNVTGAITAGNYNGLRIEGTNSGYTSVIIGDAHTAAHSTASVAIGSSAQAIGAASVAVGYELQALGGSSIAIGNFVRTSGDSSLGIGYNVQVGGTNGVALGTFSTANGNNAVALGNWSVVTGSNSVALGAGAVAVDDNTVSVGYGENGGVPSTTSKYRRIVNVAEGNLSETSHDAVIGSQLYATNKNIESTVITVGKLATAVAGNTDDIALMMNHVTESRERIHELNSYKADKADTLAGYGITDAYTQEQVNAKIAEATSGLSSSANLTELQNKVQNISNETTTNKTVVSGDVTVSGDISAKTFNGIDLSKLATASSVASNTHKIANISRWDTTTKIAGDLEVSGRITAEDLTIADWISAKYFNGLQIKTSSYGFALGDDASADEYSIAMGYESDAKMSSVSIGKGTVANSSSVSIGDDSESDHLSVSIGDGAKSKNVSVAIGYGAQADSYWAIAMGYHSEASGYHAVALGDCAKSVGERSISLGLHSKAVGQDAMALGVYSNAYGTGSVAIGKSSVANSDNVVSFGHKDGDKYGQNKENTYAGDLYRRLTNVAAGIDTHDVAIVGQLNSKADKATTLAGYGITDTYTQAEVNAKIADATSGLLTDANLTGKADKADTLAGYGITDAYTKSETEGAIAGLEGRVTDAYKAADNALESKVAAAYESADEALRSSYESADIALSGRIDETQASIALKANATDVYTKTVADEKFAVKASTLAGYGITDAYTQAEVNAKIADATSGLLTDANLTGKADKADSLSGYGITDAYTKAEVETMLADKVTSGKTNGYYSVAIGENSEAAHIGVAMGYESSAKGEHSVAIGYLAKANYTDLEVHNAVAIGSFAKAVGSSSIAIGHSAKAKEWNSIAIGTEATSSGEQSIVIGDWAKAIDEESIVIGSWASADAKHSTALGVSAEVSGEYGVAVGLAAEAGCGSVAIGSFAYTPHYSSVAIGEGAVTDADDTVSFGHNQGDSYGTDSKLKYGSDYYRRLTHVADGIDDHDVVTVGQLNSVVAYKADKANTLEGYGITDAYTQEEVNAKIEEATSGLLTDANLTGKADKADTLSGYGIKDAYTKDEVDNEISAIETSVTEAYGAADTALENRVTESYRAADIALESRVTEAYKSADTALESSFNTKLGEVEVAYKQADKAINESVATIGKAYAEADTALENRVTTACESEYKVLRSSFEAADSALGLRIDEAQASIALKANVADVYTKTVADEKFAVKASTLSGYGITDAYTQSEVNAKIADATSGFLTDDNFAAKADRSYVDLEIRNVTSAYKSADTELSNRITANEISINALTEEINSIEVGSGTASNKVLETKLTDAYKAADTALESKLTKGYQAVGNALSVRIAANEKNITTITTRIDDIDNKLNSATKSIVSDENIGEVKNKTQNISEDTTDGNTIVNGDVEILGNLTAQYANFITGASFANESVRISSDGIVRIGGSGNVANVIIYADGATSLKAQGAIEGGTIVSNGQIESVGDIVSTSGDVKAGDISLKETAQALAGKADKATTLDGYGITDAYTKAEVDSKLDGKVDAKDVYSKTDVDGKIADVASELDGKADKTYVDSNFAKVSDVYTKEEADATFVKRTELATMDENGNVIAIASRTELNGNFIVEDGVNGTEISINKGTDNQIIIGSDGSMLFGTNSTQIDDNGVFAGRIEMGENDPHNYANAQAAINQDGYIKGASGKFEVNGETGNVIGGTYNGVKLEQNSEGEAIINDVNINQMSEQVVSNYDAITGLNQRLGQMNGKLNKVGAGAAALAALHPLEYDPDDKLTFSAGVGNYAGENAAALGAFYRPDEKLMFSLGGTMGNGENMVNLGVSIGLDGASGTPKLSKKELVQKVNTMEAENQSMKAEIAELKALVAELVAKK